MENCEYPLIVTRSMKKEDNQLQHGESTSWIP